MPFFSIIIPTYNRAGFIEKTIRSILAQTFTDFEVIIVDDGSTDNTEEIVWGVNDNRLIYFKKENEERGAARNAGANIAKGKYLNFFDSDDIAYPNHLAVAYNYLKKVNAEVFHLNFDIKKGEKNKKSSLKSIDDLNQLMIKGNPLSCNGVFVSKYVFNVFKFNEDRKISGSEDYELWLRLSSRYKINNIIDITSCIIEHDDRSVFTMDKERLIERKLLMLDYAFMDKYVNKVYGKFRKKMLANAYSYIALHISLTKKDKSVALNYLLKSIKQDPVTIFEKRFLAIIKHLVI